MTSLSKTTARVIGVKPIQQHSGIQKNSDHTSGIQDELKKAEVALETAQKKRLNVIKSTEEEVSQLRATWEEEKKVIENAAYQKGYGEGYAQGEKDGYTAYQQKISEVNAMMGKARENHDRIVQKSEETIVEFALRSAEKILHQKLEEEPEVFLPLVKNVMNEVKGQPEISLYIHPDQYELVYAQIEELERLIGPPSKLSIYVKESLAPFSCIVESPFGRLDGGLDSQLAELRKKILAVAYEEIGNE